MKIISLSNGCDCVEIQSIQDLYSYLDFFHTKAMDLGASKEQLKVISDMMDIAEENNMGLHDDIDSIEYF